MIYSSWKSINSIFEDNKCKEWKVYDETKTLLRHFNPPASTLHTDSYNTLKVFVSELEIDSYVVIRIYKPGYTGKKGGDNATSIFTVYYRPEAERAPRSSARVEPEYNTGINSTILELQKQIWQLQAEREKEALRREIEELKKANKESNKGSYFEKMAESMGKGFFQDYMIKEGFTLNSEGEWIKPVNGAQPATGNAPVNGAGAKATKQEIKVGKEKAQKIAGSVKRLLAVGGDNVVDGLEVMAKMAETNPEKLQEILMAVYTK